ncbi:MAG: autotransporter-associated beta strand repeat-containing protein [Thermoguttaceae bacterium]|jgi:autotransporter-associated beta strand protein|nr:autotransporter-associated beta strand repeat-containing protein [Thermoguttaceae bacterium]
MGTVILESGHRLPTLSRHAEFLRATMPAAWLLAALAAIMLPAAASAAPVLLYADADATIQGLNYNVDGEGVPTGSITDNSNNNYGGGVTFSARFSPGTSGQHRYEKSYVRFAEGGIVFASTADAVLEFHYARAGSPTFELFGLSDASLVVGSYGTGRLGEDWPETGTGSITWNNAPGNNGVPTSGSDANAFDANAVFLYEFTTNGEQYVVTNDTQAKTDALVDFLREDTNGLVTFMIRAKSEATLQARFWSKEQSGGSFAPRLEVLPAVSATFSGTGSIDTLGSPGWDSSRLPDFPADVGTIGDGAVCLVPRAFKDWAGQLNVAADGILRLNEADTTYSLTSRLQGGALEVASGSTGYFRYTGTLALDDVAGNEIRVGNTAAQSLDFRAGSTITGLGGFTKTGPGTLVLAGTNTYEGTTRIDAGTLQVGDGGTTGTLGTGPVVNNTALVFDRSGALTVSGAISGPGTIVQRGEGTVTLAGPNTHTGPIHVKAGVLDVAHASALGAGDVLIDGGALRHSVSAEVSNRVVLDVADGLAAWWQFDGTAQDASGNAKHGTVNGATWTEDRFGRLNQALSFDGRTNNVTTTLADTFTGEFTISAWVQRTDGLSNYHQRLLGFRSFGKGIDFDASGNIFAEVAIDGTRTGTTRTSLNTVLPQDEWVHLTMVVSRPESYMRLYADGVLVAGRSLPAGGLNQYSSFLIGHNAPGSASDFVQHLIDDVRVYDRALSLDEIAQIGGTFVAGIDVDDGVEVTYTNGVIGIGGLEKLGQGTLTLAGENTYTGGTTVAAGTLHVTGSLALNGSAHVQVAAAGDAFGTNDPTILRRVAANGSFAGLGSQIVDPDTLATTADLLAGVNNQGGPLDVGMAWRTASPAETAALPPLSNLISDVLQLSGMDGDDSGRTDPFVLQMSYDASLVQPYHDSVFLAWLDGDWINAVYGNSGMGESAVADYAGSWTDFAGEHGSDLSALLGSWGVDTANHAAWAVLNHNSQFAVLAVPEPGTLLMACLGLLVMLAGGRRRKR